MRVPRSAFGWLTHGAAALTFALVILGAVVRITGSGMGCPDWPLCYGQWLPPWERAAILEWLHRDLAALVSAASVGIMAAIVASPARRARLGRPAVLLVAALVAQIGLGAYTVFQSNAPASVAWHLVMGYVFLGALLSIARRSRAEARPALTQASAAPVRVACGLAVAAVLGQAFLGGLVAAGFAGRVCPDFPTCQGAWWPLWGTAAGLQMLHRYGAVGVVGAVFFATWLAQRSRAVGVRPFLWLGVLVVGLQVLVGIGAVLGPFTLAVRVAHQVGAVGLFMACWLALDVALGAAPAGMTSGAGDAHGSGRTVRGLL